MGTRFTARRAMGQGAMKLRDARYTPLVVQMVPGQEDAIEDWGRLRRAFG